MEEEQHISEIEKKELLFLREQNRTNGQIFEIISGLSTFMIFAAILYWISSLAMIGAKYVYANPYCIEVVQVMIFSLSTLMLILYATIYSNMYVVLSDDASIWIKDFTKKFQAASKAWVKTREEIEDKN